MSAKTICQVQIGCKSRLHKPTLNFNRQWDDAHGVQRRNWYQVRILFTIIFRFKVNDKKCLLVHVPHPNNQIFSRFSPSS